MTLLFDRAYRLRFGKIGEQGKEITSLRVAFQIEKSNDSGANTASISVWNLSPESISLLQQDDIQVNLECGYGSTIGLVFSGNDILLNVRRSLPDVITEIRSQDGGEQLRTQVVSLGFEPGALFQDVVRSLISQFQNLTISDVDMAKLSQDGLPQGLIATGKAQKFLDDLLKSKGYEWSVQDGEIRVVEDTAVTDDSAVLLNYKTGLVGSPTKTKDGVNVTCLLNPRIRPYRLLQLESNETPGVSGVYKVDKVTHRGDSWGKDWYTTAECRAR